MPRWRRKLWLRAAPAAVCALDAGLTLAFQPSPYCPGGYDKVIEFSQTDRWMLAQHPLLFVAWVLVWIAAFCVAILVLPVRAGLVGAVSRATGPCGTTRTSRPCPPHGSGF